MNQIKETILIIVTDMFAEVNHLITGSIFEAENMIWFIIKNESVITDSEFADDENRSNSPFASESYLFEIVGIFKMTYSLSDRMTPMEEEALKNRIYTYDCCRTDGGI